MSDMQRRDFLKTAGFGVTAAMFPGVGGWIGQEAGKTVTGHPALVCIYLRGGMDAVNALVPFGDRKYYDMRPTIAIPAKEDEDGAGVIPLDATFGLHPSLASLKPFWDAKKFAPIINVGSPHSTRSHFDAQDFMEYAAPGLRSVKNGWLNRYLTATKGKGEKERNEGEFILRAMAMQPLLPRALRGEFPVLAVPDSHVLNNEKTLDTFEDVYREKGPKEMESGAREDDPVVAAGQDTLETLKKYKEAVKKRGGERKVTYPSGPLAQKLRDVASVIHADVGFETACIDVGGWDHHMSEGGNTGSISNMLKAGGDSLAAFAQDLGAHFDTTLVLVLSEFGRTCRENGNTGTDHGHGGAMFMLGGAVKGGKVHGTWNGLDDKSLYEGRDLPVTTDFRDVFADVLRHHMKFDVPKDFFPDYKPGSVKGLF